ncbi:hypothetical protein GGF32_005424 [Allomyces javanicus]|nr:hypothetical protein GGF32_005424 [Allomyces javanicus]
MSAQERPAEHDADAPAPTPAAPPATTATSAELEPSSARSPNKRSPPSSPGSPPAKRLRARSASPTVVERAPSAAARATTMPTSTTPNAEAATMHPHSNHTKNQDEDVPMPDADADAAAAKPAAAPIAKPAPASRAPVPSTPTAAPAAPAPAATPTTSSTSEDLFRARLLSTRAIPQLRQLIALLAPATNPDAPPIPMLDAQMAFANLTTKLASNTALAVPLLALLTVATAAATDVVPIPKPAVPAVKASVKAPAPVPVSAPVPAPVSAPAKATAPAAAVPAPAAAPAAASAPAAVDLTDNPAPSGSPEHIAHLIKKLRQIEGKPATTANKGSASPAPATPAAPTLTLPAAPAATRAFSPAPAPVSPRAVPGSPMAVDAPSAAADRVGDADRASRAGSTGKRDASPAPAQQQGGFPLQQPIETAAAEPAAVADAGGEGEAATATATADGTPAGSPPPTAANTSASAPTSAPATAATTPAAGNNNPVRAFAKHVYVSDLPPGIDEFVLRRCFRRFGKIDDVRMPRDKNTGEMMGFAYIKFTFPDAVQRACEASGQFMLNGKPVTIAVSRDETGEPAVRTLFLANVWDVNEEEISNVFGSYGTIEQCDILGDRGMVYVHFRDVEDAKRAHRELQGLTLNNRYVRIEYAQSSESRGFGFKNRAFQNNAAATAAAANNNPNQAFFNPRPTTVQRMGSAAASNQARQMQGMGMGMMTAASQVQQVQQQQVAAQQQQQQQQVQQMSAMANANAYFQAGGDMMMVDAAPMGMMMDDRTRRAFAMGAAARATGFDAAGGFGGYVPAGMAPAGGMYGGMGAGMGGGYGPGAAQGAAAYMYGAGPMGFVDQGYAEPMPMYAGAPMMMQQMPPHQYMPSQQQAQQQQGAGPSYEDDPEAILALASQHHLLPGQ